MKVHVLPHWANRDVTTVTQHDVRDVLAPIWHTKPDAARKAFNRTKRIFEYAAAFGLDVNLNAFAQAKQLLGKQDHTTVSITSMPWQEVPEFYQSLLE